MNRLTLIILLSIASSSAHAEDGFSYYMTGTQLSADCRAYLQFKRDGNRVTSAKSALDAGFCQGAVYAVLDEQTFAPSQGEFASPFCPPQSVNANDAVEVVALYLDANPDKRQQPGLTLIRDALAKAWPC